jgi:predicted nucleic acid-binding protein
LSHEKGLFRHLRPRRGASEALALTVHQGLSSGAIYDALHLVGARAAGCDELLTFNLRHFHALAPGDPMVVQP